MQPYWSFVVMDHDCDHEWYTPLRWLDLCFCISCFDYALADLDVIHGSLRFVPVVTRIDEVSWGCSMITLICVQRLHCVLLPYYTGLDSCSSGLSCLWLCLLNCFKCPFMLYEKPLLYAWIIRNGLSMLDYLVMWCRHLPCYISDLRDICYSCYVYIWDDPRVKRYTWISIS